MSDVMASEAGIYQLTAVLKFYMNQMSMSMSMSISYVNTVTLYSHKIKDNKTINIFTQI